MQNIIARLAQELRVEESRIRAAVALLDGGATVPFIARYRKEATGELDDVQLREIEARLGSLREFDERLQTILRSIEGQGQLTPVLRAALESAASRQVLEDLYLPYKPRRRTRGQMAREAGLDLLADRLWADPALDPAEQALAFLRPAPTEGGDDFSTLPAVLDGVRDLWSERWAEDAQVLAALRDWLWQDGQLHSRLRDGLDPAGAEASRYRDYFDYREALSHVPSHRALAVFRGRAQDILEVRLLAPDAVEPAAGGGPARSASPPLAEARIAAVLGWRHQGRAGDELVRRALAWTWRVKLSLSLERDLFTRLREAAEQVAVQVFATNLRHVLMHTRSGGKHAGTHDFATIEAAGRNDDGYWRGIAD
ncbi:MAG: RNA-binding transcriptional accessory protein, partial [Rhodoferax sp.]|nr:RNA-binding transcriptional accessory protein [Rhodoferax sp.]